MLLTLLWLPILPVTLSSPFQCYSCGVFLSAPTATCKGEPKKINCTGSGIRNGCISVTALNTVCFYYILIVIYLHILPKFPVKTS